RARARVRDVASVRQIHEFLAQVEAHGPGPRVVGRLLGAVDGQVLVADCAADVAASDAALFLVFAPHIAVDARGIAIVPRVPSRPIAGAVAAAIDAGVAGRPVVVVADYAIGPIPIVLTLR